MAFAWRRARFGTEVEQALPREFSGEQAQADRDPFVRSIL